MPHPFLAIFVSITKSTLQLYYLHLKWKFKVNSLERFPSFSVSNFALLFHHQLFSRYHPVTSRYIRPHLIFFEAIKRTINEPRALILHNYPKNHQTHLKCDPSLTHPTKIWILMEVETHSKYYFSSITQFSIRNLL